VNKRTVTIAVIDDDPRVLESLGELFESAGYAVRTFSSAKALLHDGLSGLDCVITDIGMPSMDGFDLHDFVKKMRPDLPVFMITGRDVTGDQQRALAHGVNRLFRKPFDGPALLGAVAKALRTHGGENASFN
jgi:FixJ family two-component response regulator